MRASLVQPQPGARNSVHQHLERLPPPVDDFLARDDHAGHVVGPVLAGVKEHAPEPAELRLRRVRLAHGERVDRAGGERARDVGGRHLHHLHGARRDAMLRERFEHDQPLVREATRDRDHVARKVFDRVNGTVLPHDYGASVAVAEVDDLDRRALRDERDRHRRDHESHLHPVGEESLLDLGEPLEHPGYEDVSVERVAGNEIGDRTSQVARDRDVSDVQLPLRERQAVVHDARPVDVQREVGRGQERGPGDDHEDDSAGATGH